MESLDQLAQKWMDWDRDPCTIGEIRKLLADKQRDILQQRLASRIQFGTAGLRGRMQAGFSSMNSLTVIEASQGLAKYITATYQGPGRPSVVIGYDARHNSHKFAFLAANAFGAADINVLWYEQVTPTPLVPFAVLLKKATAGVMITASHNPGHDNGYKVYTSNGAQINYPVDTQIAAAIEDNLEPWPSAWNGFDTAMVRHSQLYEEVSSVYCDTVRRYVTSTVETWYQPQKVIYTPIHGVGYATMKTLSDLLAIDMLTVPLQKDPDPDFPTVKFPNPEEKDALDVSITIADMVGIPLIIANDPDADRFAIVQKSNDDWFRFTGDQIGVLIASHLIAAWKRTGSASKMAMLSSAVSSSMLSKMAHKEGFHFEETLTGFKWMANVARDLESRGYDVPFAYEEALGYMFTEVCYDKDGMAAAMLFLAAQAQWAEQGVSPHLRLQQLYQIYGFHETLNTYFVSPDTATTDALFKQIRDNTDPNVAKIGLYPITRWRDATNGYDSGTDDKKSSLPVDPTSQMLTVWAHPGVRFTLRGSGTEPKVKIYIESCSDSDKDAVEAVCHILEAVLDNWIKPYAPTMTYFRGLKTSSGHAVTIA
ncbi:Phosphoglucomutase-3 [Myotisia sp. PD_48]|nr:Phosphoglucomutase-3 [Myotisia sp. PD_48]